MIEEFEGEDGQFAQALQSRIVNGEIFREARGDFEWINAIIFVLRVERARTVHNEKQKLIIRTMFV